MLSIFALGFATLMFFATPASALTADVCMQTNYTNHGKSQTLTCTANDVSVARATNISISAGGSCDATGKCTCNQGGNVTFTADYEVVLTAQARYDIGIYFGADGDPNGDGALTGQCKLTTLDNANSSNPVQLDAAPDACGDIDAAHNPQNLHLTLTVACVGDPVTHKLKLPNCTSWRQTGANDVCTVATDAFPGSPSKCNCQPGFTIDIFTETATIEVTKAAVPTSVAEIGGVVTYDVTVKNLAAQASVTLDSLVDDQYGDITTVHGAIQTTGCTLATIPSGNVSGNPYMCSFTATVPPGISVTSSPTL
jgi:hypothetical protein